YIITDAELAAFNSLRTDEERNMFIEQFWRRRDPTPGTPENEFRDEHYRRIAYANQHFATRTPGWKSDRGQAYIKWGPPDAIDETGSQSTRPFPAETWKYAYLEGVGSDVSIVFEDRDLTGEYRRAPSPGGR